MEVHHYDLQPLEDDYRSLTALDDHSAATRLKDFLATVRYELKMDIEIIFEYRHDAQEPMVMRILKTEKDLDRWIEARFMRLADFL
ncbi:hypothetical protein BH09BAC5_BH09BAC5_21150 [soil metagenome]